VGQSPTPITCLILEPSRPKIPNAIQIQSVVLPQSTGETGRSNDRWSRRQNPYNTGYALLTTATRLITAVFEKTCATTQKYVKSHVFWILKRNVKNVKKRTYSFTQTLIHNYRKSAPVSHQHQTLAQKCGHKKLCN